MKDNQMVTPFLGKIARYPTLWTLDHMRGSQKYI